MRVFSSYLLVFFISSNGVGMESAAEKSCADENVPQEFSHGWVEVPEDYSATDATAQKINVFYYVRPARDASVPPVIFFNGGPASDSHPAHKQFEKHIGAPYKNYPGAFVYMDQRGTGCSTSYPFDEPKRIAHYTSRSIVRDAEKIRAHLFGQAISWKVFGQSFGALIVHRYIETHPEHLVSAHAHGFAAGVPGDELVYRRIASQVRIQKSFFEQYPGTEKNLKKIRARVKTTDCWENSAGVKFCGPDVLDGFAFALGMKTMWWGALEGWINTLGESRNERFRELMKQYMEKIVFPHFSERGDEDTGVTPGAVIGAIEILSGNTGDEACSGAAERLAREGMPQDKILLNECRILMLAARATNSANFANPGNANTALSVDPSFTLSSDSLDLELIQEQLEKNPRLKFYVYSGRYDSIVPTNLFTEERDLLGSRIRFRELPSGHEGYAVEKRIWDDLSR